MSKLLPKPYFLVGDGACSKNPGPGGWGLIVVTPMDEVFEFGGHESESTNNKMELTAFYRGLQEIYKLERASRKNGNPENKTVHVILDSKYVIDGATRNLIFWNRNGWKTSTGTDVKNQDLWTKILKGLTEFQKLAMRFDYEFVKGHSGHDANERVDEIAVGYSQNQEVDLFQGPIEEYFVEIAAHQIMEAFEEVYLSLVNGELQRHETWAECQAATAGRPGAKFKKVKNKHEEEEILSAWGLA